MTAADSHNFGVDTEAFAVASAFPDAIKGKTVLVTGVNKLGVGYAIAEAFATQHPRCLILAARSEAKLEECLASLKEAYPYTNIRPLLVDLGSQKSVRKAASEVLAWDELPAIDLVINNAGVMNIPERTLSEDGVEMHLATNHVGHYLLTNLIMPKVISAARKSPVGATRIVNVSSFACTVCGLRASDVNWEKPASELPQAEQPNFALMKQAGLEGDPSWSYIPMAAYGASKTANVLYTVALNKRLFEKHGILSTALHPGEIDSELQRTMDEEWRRKAHETMSIKQKTLQQGASTSLWAALAPTLANPAESEYGRFLSDCKIVQVPPYVSDAAAAETLWQLTEGMVQQEFAW